MDSLLKETVEKLAPAPGFAPVESKGKLIQVVTSVDPAHSTLVCPHQPALQECHDEVDMRKQFNGILGLFSDHGGLAQIALLLQSLVARPAIGVKGAAGLHRIRAERVEASGGSIRNRTQPDSAYAFTLHLYRDDYQRLIASTRTAHAILLTAHEGRLDLNPTLPSVASRPHHCAT